MTNGKETAHLLSPNDFGKLKPYCSDRSIAYLKDSLRRLEQGQPPTPSFPLYGKRDASLVSDVLNVLGKLGIPDWLYEYEQSRVTKFGPQGGIPKWADLLDNFLLYKTALKSVRYIDTEILNTMIGEYRHLKCLELGASETLAHLKKTDKVETRAAGWSEFQLKKTDPLAQKIALQYVQSGDWKSGYGYVFSRFNKQKNRIFMPMPYSSMILQAKWFIPFLGNIQKDLLLTGRRSSYTFWADKVGFEKCFQIMEEELNDARITDDEYIVYFSNDFEKMDTRTGTSQYESFFLPILKAAFGNDRMREAMLFTTTAPIISPSGTMEGDHGTASGAEVTNGGETVCNDYFQRRLDKLLRQHISQYRLVSRRGNGDDSINIYFVKKSCPFPQFEQALRDSLEQVCEETGFDAQTEKLEISTTFGKYCQNVCQYNPTKRELFWTYPIVLTLNSITNPEHQYAKRDWDKDYRDLDIVQKIDNTYRHPAYHEFVDWVNGGLKYPLMGSSEPETARIISKYEKYRSLQSLGERYNRQDWIITSSPTLKYLLSKR